MATKSIYKNVHIRSQHDCRRLVSALENAQGKHIPKASYSKEVRDLTDGDQIKKMFGAKK